MNHPLHSKLRRPDPMAIALRKTFLPAPELTEALQGALARLIVLDLAPSERNGVPTLAWSPVARTPTRQLELTR